MAEVFEFEVRPIEGATAVVGEEVTFRNEGGRLYALNEDGEAFGVVPKAVTVRLEAVGIDSLVAEVMSRAGGVPTISVMGLGAEGAAAGAAGAATVVAAAATTSASAEEPVAEEPQAEPTGPVEQPQLVEQQPEANQQPAEQQPAATPQPEQPSQSTSQPAVAQQSAGSTQPVAAAQPAAPAASAYDSSTADQDQGGKKPKGKYIVIGVVAVVIVLFVICVVMTFAGSASDDTQTVSDGTISLEVPADWEVEEDDGSYVINSTDHDAVVTLVSSTDLLDGSLTADEVCEAVASGVNSDDDSYLNEADGEETVTSEGAIVRTYDYEYVYDDEEYEGEVEIILSGTSLSVVAAVGTDAYEDEIEDVLDSVEVLDPSEPDLLDSDAAEERDVEDDDEDAAESASSSSELLDPEIIESGYYIDEDGYVYYAVCWENPNEGYEIESPELTITGRDADGSIVFAETWTMDLLLPGKVQYVTGVAGNGTEPDTVEFGVSSVDDDCFVATDEVAEEYFTISNTNEIEDGYGGVSFTGEITTNVELEDFDEAWLSLVLRDEDGNIVYGDFTVVDVANEGGTVAFEIDEYEFPDYATYEIYAIPW